MREGLHLDAFPVLLNLKLDFGLGLDLVPGGADLEILGADSAASEGDNENAAVLEAAGRGGAARNGPGRAEDQRSGQQG
jgi:hypothetical protein